MYIRLALLGASVLVLIAVGATGQEISTLATAPAPEETLVARVYYKDWYQDAEVPMRTGEPNVYLRPELEMAFVHHRLRLDQELAGKVLVEICPIRINKYEETNMRPRTLQERRECRAYVPKEEPLK